MGEGSGVGEYGFGGEGSGLGGVGVLIEALECGDGLRVAVELGVGEAKVEECLGVVGVKALGGFELGDGCGGSAFGEQDGSVGAVCGRDVGGKLHGAGELCVGGGEVVTLKGGIASVEGRVGGFELFGGGCLGCCDRCCRGQSCGQECGQQQR